MKVVICESERKEELTELVNNVLSGRIAVDVFSVQYIVKPDGKLSAMIVLNR